MLEPDNAKSLARSAAATCPSSRPSRTSPRSQAFWEDDLAGVLLQPAVEQLGDADPDQPGPLIGPYPDEGDAVEAAMEAILLDGADIPSTRCADGPRPSNGRRELARTLRGGGPTRRFRSLAGEPGQPADAPSGGSTADPLGLT